LLGNLFNFASYRKIFFYYNTEAIYWFKLLQ
jgi:hypothetical protein